MTINEAFNECKRRYRNGDIVHCVYNGNSSTQIYTVKMDYLRSINNTIVCDDVHTNTPFIVLYNGDYDTFAPVHLASTDPRVTDLLTPVKKPPHRKEMITEVVNLVNQLDKYDKIGDIIGSLQKYQKEETLLDIQLRNFKNR